MGCVLTGAVFALVVEVGVVDVALGLRLRDAWLLANITVDDLVATFGLSNRVAMLVWTFATLLAIIQPSQFVAKPKLTVACVLVAYLLLLLLRRGGWTDPLDRLGHVLVPLDILAEEPVLHLQSRIDLRLRLGSYVDRLESSVRLSGLHLTCQDTFQALHEPAIDSLVVRELHLSQVDVLLLRCIFPAGLWSLGLRLLVDRVQRDLRCSDLLRCVGVFGVHLVLQVVVEGGVI